MAVVIQIDCKHKDGNVLPLRLASHDDPDVCHLDGQEWLPSIAQLPSLRYDFFGGDFRGNITAPRTSFTVAIDGIAGFGDLVFADARVRVWQGTFGNAWADYSLKFDGRVIAEPSTEEGVASFTAAPDDSWLDEPLLDTYAGTGGIEGPDDLTGVAKPLCLGNVEFGHGTLIDATNVIYQVNDGPVEAVNAVYDRGASLGTSTGDYADLAALIAASIPAGRWGTCKALGLVRLGAPADGRPSFSVSGDNTDGYVRKPGEIIGRIAAIAGGTTDGLAKLDSERAYNLQVDLFQQVTARQVIQNISDSVGAVAGITWAGVLFVQPLAIDESTSVKLAADGSSDYAVADVSALSIAAPFWRLATNAEPTYVVLDQGEVATGYNFRGEYSASREYRLDDLIYFTDGRAFAYINATPGSGNAPPTQPDTSNTWWTQVGAATAGATAAQVSDIAQALSDAADAQATADGKIDSFYTSSTPTGDTGDLWFKTDTGKWYRAASDGSDAITAGEWELTEDSDIAQAISDAAGAQATADGKVTTFYQASAPTAEGVGDLWVDTDDDNHPYRWNGSSWVSIRDGQIAQAITDAAGAQATADGKVTTFYQTTAPTAEGTGDLWIDTDDGNKLYRWNGSSWVSVQDADISTALSDAATAQSTADGKIVTFYQTTAPTAEGTGDLWVDTDDGNKLYRWNGSSWVAVQDNGAAYALLGLNSDGTVGTDNVVTDSIATGSVVSLTISSASGSSASSSGTVHELAYVTIPTIPTGSVGIAMSGYGQIKYLSGATAGYPMLRIYRILAANAASYLGSGSGFARNPASYGTQVGKSMALANWSNIDMGGVLQHSTTSPSTGDLYVMALDTVTHPPGGAGPWSYDWDGEMTLNLLKR